MNFQSLIKMKNVFAHISTLIFCLLLFTLLIINATYALMAPDYNFSTAVLKADIIVQGEVIDTYAEWIESPNGKNIFTFVNLRVNRVVKGIINEKEFKFCVMGGTIGDITQTVSDMPTFRAGERVIVLLSSEQRNADTMMAIPGYGKIHIEEGKVTYVGFIFPVDIFINGIDSFLKNPSVSLENTFRSIQDQSTTGTKDILPVLVGKGELLPEESQRFEKHLPQNTKSIELLALSATIYDAWWSNEIDHDGDGYKSHAWLIWDPDVSGGSGSLTVFEKIYYKLSSSGSWTLLITTSNHTITGTSTSDAQYITINGDSHNTYDWKIEIYQSGQSSPDYTRDPSNDSDLNDYKMETYTEDPGGPHLNSFFPVSGSAGTNTEVTLIGTGFGASKGNGKVEFWYGRGYPGDPARIEADIVSWSDTQIICRIPVATLNSYPASACSGPLRVTNNDGGISNEVTFIVTFSYGGYKWVNLLGDPQVNYRINENCADCTGEGTAVQVGAATWSNAGAAFSFKYNGSHSNTDVGANLNNDIMWSNSLPEGTLAQASSWGTAGVMEEADIAFNDSYYDWSSDNTPGASELDIQSIITHELGHWLTLRDLYGNIGSQNDVAKVMYGRGGPSELKRELHSDDVAGILYIYGASATRIEDWTLY